MKLRNMLAPLAAYARAGLVVCALAGILSACGSIPIARNSSYSADTLYGHYLIARFAAGQRDTATAAEHYARALAQDPSNRHLIERAFLLAVHDGKVDRAVPLARQMVALDPDDRLAHLVIALDELRSGHPRAAFNRLDALPAAGLSGFIEDSVKAWALADQGRLSEALALLENIPGGAGLAEDKVIHIVALQRMMGNDANAVEELESAIASERTPTARTAQAYVRAVQRIRGRDAAMQFLREELAHGREHPALRADLDRLERGETLEPLIGSATDGVAESLYSVAQALAMLRSVDLPSFYLQLALFMRPQFDDAYALLGDIHGSVGNSERAVAAYRHIRPSSPYRVYAGLQIAANLQNLDKPDAALAEIKDVISRYPDNLAVIVTYGDLLRARKEYAPAAEAYRKAITITEGRNNPNWALYYSLGATLERGGDWPGAEQALVKALELNRDPLVLNDLGYAWIDRNMRIKEAFDMIREAVAREPDNAAIVDSLGWGHYRLGHFTDAVRNLERAAELLPSDPTINDHLGDAFWKVGRKREARFQWQRALDLDPTPDHAAFIRRKLQFGLDAVEKEQPASRSEGI